jgi:hypothetical protein
MEPATRSTTRNTTKRLRPSKRFTRLPFHDRAANGGKLTPQERKNINGRQNSASRQIYNEKHNEKTAPR